MHGRAILAHALGWVVHWQALPKTGGQMRVWLRCRGLAGTLLQVSVDLEIPHDQSAEWPRSTLTMEKRGDILPASGNIKYDIIRKGGPNTPAAELGT